MNFLAHAFLSFNDPHILTGNMIADSVKGKDADNFPTDIAKGIYLHRFIDAYTDQHELVKKTRKVFYPVISHYAQVISDVIYDHFLGVNWALYHKDSLKSFSQKSYLDMENNAEYLPAKFGRLFPYMKADDWLYMYSTREGIHGTIDRLSYRSKQFVWAKETIQMLEDNYTDLEAHFLEFFPQLEVNSQAFLKNY